MKLGRKTLLTPELQERYVQGLQTGMGVKAAARAIHLAVPTMFRWLARGRSELSGPYRDFYLAVQTTLSTTGRVA